MNSIQSNQNNQQQVINCKMNISQHPASTPESMDMNNNSPQTIITNGDSDSAHSAEAMLTTLKLPNIDNNHNHNQDYNINSGTIINNNNNFCVQPQPFSVVAYMAPLLVPTLPIYQPDLPPPIPNLEFEDESLKKSLNNNKLNKNVIELITDDDDDNQNENININKNDNQNEHETEDIDINIIDDDEPIRKKYNLRSRKKKKKSSNTDHKTMKTKRRRRTKQTANVHGRNLNNKRKRDSKPECLPIKQDATRENTTSFSIPCHFEECHNDSTKTFHDEEEYVVHLKAHYNNPANKLKWLRCEFCDRVSAHKSNFISHITSHTNSKPYKCLVKEYDLINNEWTECNKLSSTKQNHQTHVNKKHYHGIKVLKSQNNKHLSNKHKNGKKKKKRPSLKASSSSLSPATNTKRHRNSKKRSFDTFNKEKGEENKDESIASQEPAVKKQKLDLANKRFYTLKLAAVLIELKEINSSNPNNKNATLLDNILNGSYVDHKQQNHILEQAQNHK